MHEATWRLLMRVLFALLCVVPLSTVIGWIICCSLPSHSAALEIRLTKTLGLIVRVDRVRHPRPNTLSLTGLRLIDPETRQLLAKIPALSIRQDGRITRLWADRLQLVATNRDRLWQLSRQRIIEHDLLYDRILSFRLERLTLLPANDTPELVDLRGSTASTNDATETLISFRMDGSADVEPLAVMIKRDRSQVPLQTRLIVDTKSNLLPTDWFCQGDAGRQAAFRGVIETDWRGDRWLTTCRGRLSGVDLNEIAREPIYRITGTADLDLDRAEYDANSIRLVSGRFHCTAGKLDSRLLSSLVTNKLLTANRVPRTEISPQPLIDYQKLSVQFQMDDQGLTCVGICETEQENVAIVMNDGSVYRGRGFRDSKLPVDSLIRSVIPRGGAGADQMARRLRKRLPDAIPLRR